MKNTLIILSLLLSVSAMAKDMSRTEKYEDAYVELEDGSSQYVGGCSLHQDYEGKLFTVESTIVKTFEPEYNNAESTMAKLKKVDPLLLAAAAEGSGSDAKEFFSQVDDITLEKITSNVFKGLDLYRFNLGVGGGNGYYEVYNRTEKKGVVSYTKLSNVFDGDVEYCDSSVWLKK